MNIFDAQFVLFVFGNFCLTIIHVQASPIIKELLVMLAKAWPNDSLNRKGDQPGHFIFERPKA